METKICTKCKIEKPLEDFSLKYGKPIARCLGCKRESEKLRYYSDKEKARQGRKDSYWRNREKRLARQKQRAIENPEAVRVAARKTYLKHRERRLAEMKAQRAELPVEFKQLRSRVKRLKMYGLSLEDFARLSERQNHRCAICDEPLKLHVDHDHLTNKVRGLLCFDCNTSLGKLKENPDVLERARDYLLSGGIL